MCVDIVLVCIDSPTPDSALLPVPTDMSYTALCRSYRRPQCLKSAKMHPLRPRDSSDLPLQLRFHRIPAVQHVQLSRQTKRGRRSERSVVVTRLVRRFEGERWMIILRLGWSREGDEEC